MEMTAPTATTNMTTGLRTFPLLWKDTGKTGNDGAPKFDNQW
jgi:hypothetical protein